MNTPLALNRNEYFFPHASTVLAALAGTPDTMSHYASPAEHGALLSHLAQALKVEERSITLCHGAEDGLLKILSWQRRFCEHLWVADFSWLNYLSMATGLDYAVHTFGKGADLEHFSTNFSTDLTALHNALSAAQKPALVLLASPNNPTGQILELSHFEKLLAAHPRHTFVLDGVYDAFQTQFVHLPDAYSNCFFVGSFSKYFGLPGLRMGYVVGKMPAGFSLTLGLQPTALAAAVAAVEALTHYTRNRNVMQKFAQDMESWKSPHFQVFPTHAPFVLVKLLKLSIPAEVFSCCELASEVCPKYFSRGHSHFLRWGLGPQSVNTRIETYMKTLGKLI